VDGGSNGAIFDSNKFKMAAAAILDNFEWPYLRNGSRSIYIARIARSIFAIAQLSCYYYTYLLFAGLFLSQIAAVVSCSMFTDAWSITAADA